MDKEPVILGIDTSNYTTSLAMMDLHGKLVTDERRVLSVKEGTVGLRQSEALFQHIKGLPVICKTMAEGCTPFKIVAISSAVKPRPLENSYMPVFVAAESFGSTMSTLWNVPFYEFSHQEGHIMAGLWSLGLQLNKPFMVLHISGGTTEVLSIIPKKIGFEIEIIGGTSDLSAGQFIDRIGVKLNLPFPAGAHMEKIIDVNNVKDINIPVSVKDTFISFSGPETFVQRRLKDNFKASDIAFSTFQSVGKSLYLLIKNSLKKYDYEDILVVGGVASNKIIKNFLEEKLQSEGLNLYFGTSKYCSDNAVGIAALGVDVYLQQNKRKLG